MVQQQTVRLLLQLGAQGFQVESQACSQEYGKRSGGLRATDSLRVASLLLQFRVQGFKVGSQAC